MKKIFKMLVTTALVGTMIFSLAACGTKKTPGSETPNGNQVEDDKDKDQGQVEDDKDGGKQEEANNSETVDLALITDVGTIDDKSFNQGSWEGLEQYAKENNITHKYYQPLEKSDEAYLTSIALAVKAGAKVIVCPGFLFEVPIFEAQTLYPDVQFIILDGAPHAGDYNNVVEKNTYAVFYAEEEAGFLAGYAAVEEGYTKLGFMGGMAVPAVVRFGYGFAQGAEYAAKELGLADGALELKYTYVGDFNASPEHQAKAAAWYNEGTEVIFACGGAVGNSVMKAAEGAGTKVIGVDVDQSSESDTVITSAMKNLSKSVYDALTAYYKNEFPGGKIDTLNASVGGVQLPMETSKFTKFTQETYDALYQKIVNKEITIDNDSIGLDVKALNVQKVVIEDIK